MVRRAVDWFENRTGLVSAVRGLLDEEIPASSGWHQVLGSVAVFLFLLQALTGILLAFNYAATPGEAYNSIRYIMTDLTGGRLIRNMHHWGASLMIIVVVLHMAQVFLYGAYKKPREATWMLGVFLLLVTLAFGLTGYLLPWDNKAYWGTVVTTEMAAKAPLVGPYLARLMGSADGVGAVTFARFYTLHVMLLPAVMIGLIIFHVYLVRRHGVAPVAGDDGPPTKFFPEQVFRDTVAIFAAFAGLLVLSVAVQAPLERLADPTDIGYVPRPEWYFLFLFQILKYLPGPLEVFGSIVLPALAVIVLLLVPVVDRREVMRLTRRTTAFAAAGLAMVGWGGLTVAAVVTTPPAPVILGLNDDGSPQAWAQLAPLELAGIGYFRAENCSSCHRFGEQGGAGGPGLGRTTVRRDAAWLIDHFKNPQQVIPGSPMPSVRLNDAQLNTLAALLLKLTASNAEALLAAPDYAVAGAMIYEREKCSECHKVNGIGKYVGPPLNGVRRRHSKEWIIEHFHDPAAFSPETEMKPYPFPDEEVDDITNYLLSLPEE